MLTIKEYAVSTGTPGATLWFAVSSVEIVNDQTLRVWFTQPPSSSATNTGHYTFSPSVTVNTASYIGDVNKWDSHVDLNLTGFSADQYTLTVSSSITSLVGAQSLPATTIVITVTEYNEVTNDSVNPDSIINLIPKAFKNKRVWNALGRAIDAGDQVVRDLAKSVFDQLYLSTASSKWLNSRAIDQGIEKPYKLGISDDKFRELAIAIKNDKVIEEGILEIASVLYGQQSVYPYLKALAPIFTSSSYPNITQENVYSIFDGAYLDLSVDDGEIKRVGLNSSSYSNPVKATVQEIATDLNNGFINVDLKALATEINGELYIFPLSKGLSSRIKCHGGTLQPIFNFGNLAAGKTTDGAYSWTISNPSSGLVRFLHQYGTETDSFNIQNVLIGDTLVVRGPEWPSGVIGCHTIVDVNVYYSGANRIGYIDVALDYSTGSTVITQSIPSSITAWHQVEKSIYDDPLWVAISQDGGKSLISIPATSTAVDRNLDNGSYLNPETEYLADFTVIQHTLWNGEKKTTATIPTIQIPAVEEGGLVNITEFTSTGEATSPPSYISNVYGTGNFYVETSGDAYVVFGKAATGAIQKVSDTATQQYLWTIGGASGYPSWTASELARCYRLSKDQVTQNVSATLTGTYSSGTNAYYFTTPVVLNTPRYQNHLLVAGGFSTYGTVIETGAYVIAPDGTLAGTIAPNGYTMAKATAIEIPTHGVVLFTGGCKTTADYFSDANNEGSIFSPQEETWTAITGNLTDNRLDHQCILLDDGETVLVIGGRNGQWETDSVSNPSNGPIGNALNSCELIKVTSPTENDAPVRTGRMSDRRFAFGCVKLPDGRVLVCGGIGYSGNQTAATSEVQSDHELRSCEIYDPATELWTPITPMLEPHSYCTCSYDKDKNQVVVWGGINSSLVEYLDLNTWTWNRSANTFTGTYSNLITGFGSPVNVLDEGGFIFGGGHLSSVNIIANQKSWVNTNKLPSTISYSGIKDVWQVYYVASGTSYLRPLTTLGEGESWADGVVRVLPFKVDSIFPGPYSLDPTVSYQLTTQTLTVNEDILKGTSHTSLQVISGGMGIENGDYIVINPGYKNQQGPIKCFGYISDTEIMIDPAFKFTQNIYTVSTPTAFVVIRGEFTGKMDNVFVLTASNAGKAAFLSYLDKVSACGIQKEIEIRYPGDRGLGNEGLPTSGQDKLSDIVQVYGDDNLDAELKGLRNV